MEFEIENNVLKKYNGWDEHVVVPDGVTEIGKLAFYGCTSVKIVSLPNSIKKIDDLAFYCCSQLTNIDIPYGVKVDIGEDAFKHSKISITDFKGGNVQYNPPARSDNGPPSEQSSHTEKPSPPEPVIVDKGNTVSENTNPSKVVPKGPNTAARVFAILMIIIGFAGGFISLGSSISSIDSAQSLSGIKEYVDTNYYSYDGSINFYKVIDTIGDLAEAYSNYRERMEHIDSLLGDAYTYVSAGIVLFIIGFIGALWLILLHKKAWKSMQKEYNAVNGEFNKL